MNPPRHTALPPEEFDRRFLAWRPSLLAAARRHIDPDTAEDLVQATYVAARDALPDYDDGEPATAEARCSAWLHTILANALRSAERRRLREPQLANAHLARAEEEHLAAASQADLALDEIRSDARFRLRFTPLAQDEALCLVLRLEGVSLRRISRCTGLSISTVARRYAAGVAKLRASPVAGLAAPDIEHYLWKLGCAVTIYRRPTSWGAKAAREALRKLR